MIPKLICSNIQMRKDSEKLHKEIQMLIEKKSVYIYQIKQKKQLKQ